MLGDLNDPTGKGSIGGHVFGLSNNEAPIVVGIRHPPSRDPSLDRLIGVGRIRELRTLSLSECNRLLERQLPAVSFRRFL